MHEMNTMLRHHLAINDIVTLADAAEYGYDRHAVHRMVRTGELHRVHQGVFVAGSRWRAASETDRHLLRCRAVLDRFPDAALSHVSAIVAHDLPVHAADHGVVHLIRRRVGRIGGQGSVQMHPWTDSTTVVAAGTAEVPTCTIAVAVLQLADWSGPEAGMVAAEAALHRGRITRDDLRHAREMVRLGRGRAHADLVVRLADRLSESPGETLTRLLLLALDIHAEQQVEIPLPSGGVARVDFLLRELGVVLEFDGAAKYDGARGRDALVREKHREDGVRSRGYEVVRLMWSDRNRPAKVRQLIAAAATRAARTGPGVRAPRGVVERTRTSA